MSTRPVAHCAIVAMRQAPVKQSRGLSDAVPTVQLPNKRFSPLRLARPKKIAFT